jgi:hypothetical protein
MSSILKALKKLEEEKAARQGQRVDITKDIFGSAQQPAARSPWPVIAAGAAGVVVLGVVAYLFMARPGSRQIPPVPVPAENRQTATAPAPSPSPLPVQPSQAPPLPTEPASGMTPAAAAPATVMVAPAAPPKAAAVKPMQREAGTVKAPTRSLATQKAVTQASAITGGAAKNKGTKAPAAIPSPAQAIPVISANHPVISAPPATQQQARPTAPPTAPTAPASASLPTITVSGIAYNKDAADRLAVINGVPVGEGKTVSGAKVEEIMPDKVRFSLGQKTFEVPVGRSNQ